MLIAFLIVFTLLILTSWYFREMMARFTVVFIYGIIWILALVIGSPFLLWDWITNKEDKEDNKQDTDPNDLQRL
nr:MAG TPA: hypothetical protein [Caudoviricetes sp.]